MQRTSRWLFVLACIVCIAVYGCVKVLFEYFTFSLRCDVVEMEYKMCWCSVHLLREAFRRFVYACFMEMSYD